MGEPWAVLVAGAARTSIVGSQDMPTKNLTADTFSIMAVAAAYEQLVERFGRERIVVIGLLQETLDFLHGASQTGVPAWGSRGEGTDATKAEYAAVWKSVSARCARLIADGGADYDGRDVNPTTVSKVLMGIPIRPGAKVVPMGQASSILLSVASHGNCRSTTKHPVGPCDVCGDDHKSTTHKYAHEHSSLHSQEWYFHMPYAATDPEPYGFVSRERSETCMRPMCTQIAGRDHDVAHPLNCVYWQHLFTAFHAIYTHSPHTNIVAVMQYCTSGGALKFMSHPAFRQHHQIDKWPLFMIATCKEDQASLNVFLDILLSTLSRLGPETALKQLYDTALVMYWRQNSSLRKMNKYVPLEQRVGEVCCSFGAESGVEHVPIAHVFGSSHL